MAALFPLPPWLWLESQQSPQGDTVHPSPNPHRCYSGRPAGHLHPSPGHSLAPLADTTRTRPSPTSIPQPLPQPRRPLPGQAAVVGCGQIVGGEGSHHRSQGG